MKPMTTILVCLLLAASALPVAAQDVDSTSGEVLSNCSVPTRPEIPNGRNATEEEMLEAQRMLKTYLADGDSFINCLEGLETKWGASESDEQRAVIVIFHNRMVDEMQSTGDLFNQAVRAFKGKRGS